jgi:hypothetical protein
MQFWIELIIQIAIATLVGAVIFAGLSLFVIHFNDWDMEKLSIGNNKKKFWVAGFIVGLIFVALFGL